MSAAHTDEDIMQLIVDYEAAMEELRAQGIWRLGVENEGSNIISHAILTEDENHLVEQRMGENADHSYAPGKR